MHLAHIHRSLSMIRDYAEGRRYLSDVALALDMPTNTIKSMLIANGLCNDNGELEPDVDPSLLSDALLFWLILRVASHTK